MHKVMKTLVIWNNMILEEEFDDESLFDDNDFDQGAAGRVRQFTEEERQQMKDKAGNIAQGLGRRLRSLQDQDEHYQLRDHLIQHLWNHHANLGL